MIAFQEVPCVFFVALTRWAEDRARVGMSFGRLEREFVVDKEYQSALVIGRKGL